MVESLRVEVGTLLASREAKTAKLSDTDVLDLVYREHAPRMWRTLAAYSGSREIAEDAVAESFAQALTRGRELWAPERWVWKTAYRIAAGELKRRAANPVMTVDDSVQPEEPAWELRDALTRLSPTQRAAVVLHHYAGYPARDIARIVGSTPAAVWVHLSQGRRRLRQMLEEADGRF